MMTIAGGLASFRRLLHGLRRGELKGSGGFPLYRLAPARDLGVRRVRLSSLTGGCAPGAGPRGKKDARAVLHFPRPGGLAASFLALLGLEPGGTEALPVRVARVQGSYVVEKGWGRLLLASLLGLEYVCARVVEYDYGALKKNMRVFRFPEGVMVGVVSAGGKRCSYHGVEAGDLDLLLTRHGVPFVDSIAAPGYVRGRASMARAGGAAAPARVSRQLKLVHSQDS
ncbi:MAG: hypothetical protein K6T29_05000 [Peptococcaceae bacterium]|nr:hypothetical protein [Peptococcaceae bacterium]